ncbi:G2/mitotic-specific cyclin-B, partial [Geodia barretti]
RPRIASSKNGQVPLSRWTFLFLLLFEVDEKTRRMALRAFHTSADENVSHIPRGKAALTRMDIKPRTALGTIGGNSLRDRHAPSGKGGVTKTAFAVPAQITRVKTDAFTTRPPSQLTTSTTTSALPTHNRQPTPAHKPTPPQQEDEFPEPEVMDMDVGQIALALSNKLVIEDIDESDRDNPQLCAEYVKEIYAYMRELEIKYQVDPAYLSTQSQINSKMRAILIDWLIQVHLRFTLLQETLYLTVSIIDRYLQVEPCDKSDLQLVGVTAMLIASKYEEMYAPQVDDFVFITDRTYSSDRIRSMERHMLNALDYSFGNPLCLHFLRRYSRAGNAGPEMHTMAKFLLELSLTDYHCLRFLPSQLAATALYISCKICSDGEWVRKEHRKLLCDARDFIFCPSGRCTYFRDGPLLVHPSPWIWSQL